MMIDDDRWDEPAPGPKLFLPKGHDCVTSHFFVQVCLQGIGKHWKRSLRRSTSDGDSSFGVNTYGMSRKTESCQGIIPKKISNFITIFIP
jgi:hypothetical protein